VVKLLTKPVLIVGASMAGLRTAEALRRFGYAGPITAIGDEKYAPYNRPPLSKEVLSGDEVTFDSVAFAQRAATADVNWVLGNKAVAADLEAQTVTCADGSRFEFSNLVIATGLRPKRAELGDGFASSRHVIRSLDDAIALRAALVPGAKVVVLGAGFIGCETAATARKLGCAVTIVAPSDLPIVRILGATLAAEIMRRQQAQGVKFAMKQNISSLIGEGDKLSAVMLDNGSTLECDVLIEAIGSHSNTEWLASNDIDIADGVLCDNNLRAAKTSGGVWPNVFAVGDVAKFVNVLFDETPRRVEHWNIPTESGKHVGQLIALAMAGDSPVAEPAAPIANTAAPVTEAAAPVAKTAPTPNEQRAALEAASFRPIPSFWSDQFDIHLLAFGLLALADSNKLVQGEISDDCVFEYYRGDKLVGVAGIGMRSVVQGYRNVFAEKESK